MLENFQIILDQISFELSYKISYTYLMNSICNFSETVGVKVSSCYLQKLGMMKSASFGEYFVILLMNSM